MICSDVDEWCINRSLDINKVQRCIESTRCLLGDGLRAARTLKLWAEETDRKTKCGQYMPAHSETNDVEIIPSGMKTGQDVQGGSKL